MGRFTVVARSSWIEAPLRSNRHCATSREGYCSTDDLKYVGAELWDALLAGDCSKKVRESIEGTDYTTIALQLPPELEALPWEALYDSRLRFIGCHPKICLIHRLELANTAPPDVTERISILVVIPSGSGLDVDTEWANIRASVAKLGDSVRLEDLRGLVTPDRLCDELMRRHWHVVHFIGHGRLANNFVEVRLNDERGGECWRTAEEFSAIFQGATVDVCIMNCLSWRSGNGYSNDRSFGPRTVGRRRTRCRGNAIRNGRYGCEPFRSGFLSPTGRGTAPWQTWLRCPNGPQVTPSECDP